MHRHTAHTGQCAGCV